MDKQKKVIKKLERFYGFGCPELLVEICESRKEFEEKNLSQKVEIRSWPPCLITASVIDFSHQGIKTAL